MFDEEMEKYDLAEFKKEAVAEWCHRSVLSSSAFAKPAAAGSSLSVFAKPAAAGSSLSVFAKPAAALLRFRSLASLDLRHLDGLELDHNDDLVQQKLGVKNGPPPTAAVDAVIKLGENFFRAVHVVAAEHRCKVETLLQALGVLAPLSRETSRWGAFEFVWRIDHPRPEGVSAAQWAVECKKHLSCAHRRSPRGQKNDPFVLRRIYQPYIDRFLDANITALCRT
ncbi:hypothetical protein C8F01DRAFT_1075419 [Mycena amicta]|nr:hypothetical protein C8F01DRAFT_1075419 [Mycena amicta]